MWWVYQFQVGFRHLFNNLNNGIKFTVEIGHNKLNFLDLTISINSHNHLDFGRGTPVALQPIPCSHFQPTGELPINDGKFLKYVFLPVEQNNVDRDWKKRQYIIPLQAAVLLIGTTGEFIVQAWMLS